MPQLFQVIAVSCAIVGPLGAANAAQAQASYRIMVDCRGTGGVPSWAGTNDDVEIWVKINNAWQKEYDAPIPNSKCDTENEFVWTVMEGFTADDVQAVAFYIYNTDTFWIDEWELQYSNGDDRWHEGTDNTTGWCLSEDSGDASSYCWNGVADEPWVWCGPDGEISAGCFGPF